MTNFLIYGGLGLLLIGAIFGLIAAVIGCKIQHWKFPDILLPKMFFGPMPKLPQNMKKCLLVWGITWVVGIVILIIGLNMGLK